MGANESLVNACFIIGSRLYMKSGNKRVFPYFNKRIDKLMKP